MNDQSRFRIFAASVFVAAALLVGSGWMLRGCMMQPDVPDVPVVVVPVVEPVKPDRVVYVYEKDSGGIPSAVAAGISKLNSQGIVATTFEDDSTDGDGEVPEQYALALPAAREAGLPCLVVSGGGKVLRVVKVATADGVLEAVK